jgi:DNA-binding Lrp family transcriptional regulator
VSDEEKALEVIRVLSDEYSRKIVLSIITTSLPIETISNEQHIPASTCYRRIHELLSYGIVRADKTIVQEDGKKFICYKSSFKSALIRLESGELKVDLVSNKNTEDKLHDIWEAVRSAGNLELKGHEVSQIAPSASTTEEHIPLIRH